MTETRTPWILVAISAAIYAGIGLYSRGPIGSLMTLLFVFVQVLISVACYLGVAFVASQVLNMNFGTFNSAAVKFAAIAAFPFAAALLVGAISPILAFLVGIGLLIGLLVSFFEMDVIELVVFVGLSLLLGWLFDQAFSWLPFAAF